jgi:type IV pilus assembly protein PilP
MTIIVYNKTTKRSKMSKLIAAHRIAMVLLISLTLGLSGCESEKRNGSAKDPVVTKQITASPKKVSPNGKKSPSAKKDPVTTEVPTAEAAPQKMSTRLPYNPVGRVDPFTPLYKEETEKKAVNVVVKPKSPERPRTPLEKLDLAQLKLTAIVTTQGSKRALVEEASGKGYVVMVGTRIGLERGAVVEIEQDRIVIEHQGEDDFGKVASKKRELKLQKPPGD